MSAGLREQLAQLPGLLAAHVTLSLLALLLGVVVSIPLGLFAARRPILCRTVLGVASVLQTIPSLALLALMVALLASFGFWPALLALFLYSALPVLRNTITGVQSVNDDIVAAATSLGMSDWQRLLSVEVPLAAPVIVAGVRTAAVLVVGTATLATPVGQRSLGNFIFAGLQTRNFQAVLVGCVAAACLALALDMLLATAERALRQRNPRRALYVACGLAAGLLLALLAPGSAAQSAPSPVRAGAGIASARAPGRSFSGSLRVGSKAFTEQYILAAAMAKLLERQGFAVDRRESLGSTIAFDALRNGQLDAYVDYSGTLWSNVLGHQETETAWLVRASVCGALADRFQIRCLGALGFENSYAFAMRGDRAKELGVSSLLDLSRVAEQLRFGSDLEFLQRPEWKHVRENYDLRFREQVTFDPTFVYEAAQRRDVDVIIAFSSDARIAAYQLVTLDDPRHALPPYDALLLLSARAADDERVARALSPLVGAIDIELMRLSNLRVDGSTDRQTPEQAAAWLVGQIGALK